MHAAPFRQLTACWCVSSSSALQHHDHHLDLHGPADRPRRLPGHRHLQETARLHFTTLPIAAVCATLSLLLYRASVCDVSCDLNLPCDALLSDFIHMWFLAAAEMKVRLQSE